MVQRDHQLRPVAADGCRDIPAQTGAVLDHSVAVVEELDAGDPDGRRTRALLPLAQRRALLRFERVDAGLAAGGQEVGDVTPLIGPARDGRRAAVLQVVGVSDDGEGAPPVRGHGFELLRHVGRLTAPASRSPAPRKPPLPADAPGLPPPPRGETPLDTRPSRGKEPAVPFDAGPPRSPPPSRPADCRRAVRTRPAVAPARLRPLIRNSAGCRAPPQASERKSFSSRARIWSRSAGSVPPSAMHC